MSGAPPRAGFVRVRGWSIDTEFATHTIALGPDIPGLELPRDIYLDGRPLVRVPLLPTKTWHHSFRLDGGPAVVGVALPGGRRGGLQFYLRIGDAEPQPVAQVDVPAATFERLAKPTRPLARLGLLVLAILGVGFGLIIPTYRPHLGGRDPAVVVALTFGLGAFALAWFLWARLRGRPPGWSATALFWFGPFDLGTIGGYMVARALGVGSAQGPTDVVETGLVVAAGILVLLIAAGWFWFTRPAMSPEFVPMRRLGARIGSLGCATIGLAILVAAFGLFGASIHNAGVSALIALVGAIVVMAGVLISWIGMRRA